MKSVRGFSSRRVGIFFLSLAVKLLWDGLLWHIIIASTSLCGAFILPGASQSLLLQERASPNQKKFVTRTRLLSSQNSANQLNEDYSDEAFPKVDHKSRERVETRRRSSQGQRGADKNLGKSLQNPSRRDFVTMGSILTGLASGAIAPGSSAAELLFWKEKSALSSATEKGASTTILPIEATFVEPFSSVRKYKSITLSNGIRVLLVSDKNAQQSSAALTINGAGQFSDPAYVTGLAHLMEHMVLSSRPGTSKNQGDFQEWLDGDYAEGFSNGFTAYEKVCFHFTCATGVFGEALERFSNLFVDKVIQKNCFNREAVRREVRRVDSELDKNDLFTRELYLTKSLINPKHPYAKVTLGSIETLETLPAMADIDVSQQLYNFFEDKYQPTEAILVVVSSEKLSSLESMVQSFSTTMSNRPNGKNYGESGARRRQQRIFPPFLLSGAPIRPICLFRGRVSNDILADDLEKISFQWALDQDYSDLLQPMDKLGGSKSVETATQIGFVMAEILGRRGPGSLFKIFKNRKWIPEGNRGLPRISFPVDVSGFQILRLEIVLTQEGFSKRSSVAAAVFDYLDCLRTNPPNRELISQYCSSAQLYGHVLAPRPPDAIELAFDGQIYGIDGPKGVGSPTWRLLPLPDDTAGIQALQKTIQTVLTKVSDPSNAITIVTASQRAIFSYKSSDFEESFPLFSPASWDISPTTQARYLSQNNVLTGKINQWMVARIMEEKLSPPVLNPLIPATLRPPRMLPPGQSMDIVISSDNNNKNLQALVSAPSANEEFQQPSIVRDYWALLKTYSHNDVLPFPGLNTPRIAPEPSARSTFVLQLMSSRPPRATTDMAAHAEIWRLTLDASLVDLAELGAPGGLAYDISYNKYGMRVAFLGLSQNLSSYARRIARRMIDHTNQLLEGSEDIDPKIIEAAIRNTNRFRMAPNRKSRIVGSLKQTSASDAAKEGTAFFQSCCGAVCFSQGDLLPAESLALLADLKKIFRKVTGTNVRPAPAIPEVEDILYRANWTPRSASVCSLPGSILISNPCGRVPR